MIGDVVAGVGSDGVDLLREYCQMERDDAVASCNGRQVGRIGARLCKSLFIKFVFLIKTNGTLQHGVENRVDGKMKDSGAVASVNSSSSVCQSVFSNFCKGGVKTVQRVGKACADLILKDYILTVMDGQMQVDDAVTTACCGVLLSIISRFVVGL